LRKVDSFAAVSGIRLGVDEGVFVQLGGGIYRFLPKTLGAIGMGDLMEQHTATRDVAVSNVGTIRQIDAGGDIAVEKFRVGKISHSSVSITSLAIGCTPLWASPLKLNCKTALVPGLSDRMEADRV
jgi:hypothetical protein